MHRIIIASALSALVVFAASCGSSNDGTDTGTDTSPDVAVDAVADQGIPDSVAEVRDAQSETGTDIPHDADVSIPDVPDTADVSDVRDAVDAVDVDVADIVDAVDVEDTRDVRDAGTEDVIQPCPPDGFACTTEERDGDGICVSHVNPGWCLIGDVCFEQGAVNGTDVCHECRPETSNTDWTVAASKVCDDGFKCTQNDLCGVDGVCAGNSVTCQDDGNSCTVEACNPDTGECATTTLPNGSDCQDDLNQCTLDRCQAGTCMHVIRQSTCDDGNKCTYSDMCNAQGNCVGIPKSCPDDGNICTDNGCNPDTGTCRNDLINDGRTCDDLNWCTEEDGCYLGECMGTPRSCSDQDPCTGDSCVDGPAGYCTHDVIIGSCEDGNLCTMGEVCGTDGICKGGVLITCDDYNPCTNDSCNPAIGCVYQPNQDPCTDSNPCTEYDVCTDGRCVGTPKDCDDHNECTRDYCQYGNCRHDMIQNGTGCDDGNVCTTGGTCLNAACVSTGTIDCADSDLCTDDLCNPETGCYHQATVCSDLNSCTNDSCNPSTGCVFSPNSNRCNDNDGCTENDTCSMGQCQGTPVDCSDSDPCTINECIAGMCTSTPNLGFCDDGNACTEGEKCYAGQCTGGSAVVCNDGSDCTYDSCNAETGCVFTPRNGSCDDGTVCTLNDRCESGRCVGDPLNCSDGNFCTNDLCHPLSGCYWENNALLCDDSNPCTVVDQCGNGTCAGTNIFRNPVVKGATYQIGSDGKAGNGLDVDGNSQTCMPAGKCENGIDNAFAGMSLMVKDQFNPDLAVRTASGDLAMLIEMEEPGPVGSPFDMKLVFGKLTAPTTCNPTGSGCNYLAFKADTIGQCTPRYAFDNSETSGSTIIAGGTDYEAIVYFMVGSTPVPVTLKWARVEASVTISGNQVTGGSGVLAGVIDKADFKYALQAVPESQYSPYTRSQVILNVDQTLQTDADVDGNGTKESSSIGIAFTIVNGSVVGRTN